MVPMANDMADDRAWLLRARARFASRAYWRAAGYMHFWHARTTLLCEFISLTTCAPTSSFGNDLGGSEIALQDVHLQ